jgi:hypothetical protein
VAITPRKNGTKQTLLTDYKPRGRRDQGPPCKKRTEVFECNSYKLKFWRGTGLQKSPNHAVAAAAADDIVYKSFVQRANCNKNCKVRYEFRVKWGKYVSSKFVPTI